MKSYENPRVGDWAIRQILIKLNRQDRTGPFHASEVYQCLRKTIMARREPAEYGRDAVLRFATGFALQEYFLGPEEDGIEALNIVLSADRMVKGQVLEFKSTRKPYEALPKDPLTGKGIRGAEKVKFDAADQDQWVLRVRAYCAAHNVNRAHILVYFIYGDDLRAWTFEFTDEELDAAREEVASRVSVLNQHVEDDTLPSIHHRIGTWECNYCPYLKHCAAELEELNEGS